MDKTLWLPSFWATLYIFTSQILVTFASH